MTISEDDVAAARRILAEHEAKYGDVPKIQVKKVKTPIDHPDWATKPDRPDDDMALIESMASEIEWRVKYLHQKVTHGITSIYNSMRARYNDKGEWSPLAAMAREISVMESIGRQIQEDW